MSEEQEEVSACEGDPYETAPPYILVRWRGGPRRIWREVYIHPDWTYDEATETLTHTYIVSAPKSVEERATFAEALAFARAAVRGQTQEG